MIGHRRLTNGELTEGEKEWFEFEKSLVAEEAPLGAFNTTVDVSAPECGTHIWIVNKFVPDS